MTDTEYEQIMNDVDVGRVEIVPHMAGAKNLFLTVSPSRFKAQTGCSVWVSCHLTRTVVYLLDPLLVIASAVFGFHWVGVYGLLLSLPCLFLWSWTKMYFSTVLPTGWTALFMSAGITCIGEAFFKSPVALPYFGCLGMMIFQNYLLYAVPLSDVLKCAHRSKAAFELFCAISKNTISPIVTVIERREYVGDEAKP